MNRIKVHRTSPPLMLFLWWNLVPILFIAACALGAMELMR